MAIFSEPIVLNPAPAVKSGEVEKTGTRGKKRFFLNSTKEGQQWSIFAPDSSTLDKTEELYSEHGIEKRGDQELMYVEIGVRQKSQLPPEVADGLEKLNLPDLRTKAASKGVPDTALMGKPQLIEAIRAKGK